MKGYQAIYVCRLCGERHSGEESVQSKYAAKSGVSFSGRGFHNGGIEVPWLHAAHICPDGSVGVGDFQGYQYKED